MENCQVMIKNYFIAIECESTSKYLLQLICRCDWWPKWFRQLTFDRWNQISLNSFVAKMCIWQKRGFHGLQFVTSVSRGKKTTFSWDKDWRRTLLQNDCRIEFINCEWGTFSFRKMQDLFCAQNEERILHPVLFKNLDMISKTHIQPHNQILRLYSCFPVYNEQCMAVNRICNDQCTNYQYKSFKKNCWGNYDCLPVSWIPLL